MNAIFIECLLKTRPEPKTINISYDYDYYRGFGIVKLIYLTLIIHSTKIHLDFSEIRSIIKNVSFKKLHLKTSSSKCRPYFWSLRVNSLH